MNASKRGFVEKLFAEHGRALQAFLYRRLRTKADAADLAQEVYLRMLRVTDPDAIRNPQHYLYAVASNLVKERAILNRRRRTQVDVNVLSNQDWLEELPSLDAELEARDMDAQLRGVLEQLPERWRTALVLQYRYELTYAEISDRMGVSSNTVKKYLAQGLEHCRRLMRQPD